MYLPPTQYVSQSVANRRPLIMWAMVVMATGVFVTLIVVAPLARANGFGSLSFVIYETFSHVCHQAPERSFFIAGHPFAVCARCTGLYLGFAVAVITYPLTTSLKRTRAPERRWLFMAAVPLAIDFSVGFLGIWDNTHSSRLLTGALLGAAAVFYIMPGLTELSMGRFGQRERKASIPAASFGPSHEQVMRAPSDYSAPLRRI